jgi:hypothetical protein
LSPRERGWNHEVTLTDEEGQSLTLHARAIRRIYAVVSTADTIGSASTTLDLLWKREILPDRATPLIIAVQHLHLLTDLLRTPLELLGYLDYREEILADPRSGSATRWRYRKPSGQPRRKGSGRFGTPGSRQPTGSRRRPSVGTGLPR